jgi:hypothetical protein
MPEFEVSDDKVVSESVAQYNVGFVGAQGVEKVEGQALDVSRLCRLGCTC